MISLAIRVKQIEKFAVDNSPTILTTIGALGTIGTAILTHKAATKASQMLADDFRNLDMHEQMAMGKKDKLKLVWTAYIPPVVVGGLTITAVVSANRIGSKRAAAIAAAYTISEKAYTEYRDKVVEKFGDQKERNMREELAQDQVNRNPQNENNVVIVGDGEVLCCDLFSGRYFRSSVESLRKAANEVNFLILHNGFASLTDFYNEIQINRTDVSDEIGWNQDKLLELDISAVVNEEGQPCVAFRFQVHPVRGYYRIHP